MAHNAKDSFCALTCPFFVVSCWSMVSGFVFPTVGSPLIMSAQFWKGKESANIFFGSRKVLENITELKDMVLTSFYQENG